VHYGEQEDRVAPVGAIQIDSLTIQASDAQTQVDHRQWYRTNDSWKGSDKTLMDTCQSASGRLI
jgi:hypothetical protein